MALPRILLIEDDERLAGLIQRLLQEHGHHVDHAADGDAGMAQALATPPDLLIMDVMLPGSDGIDVVRQLRPRMPELPVLFLTALGSTDDKLRGFDAGADDYLVKPFDLRELLARVKVLMKRNATVSPDATLKLADLELDQRTRRVRRAGQEVKLTPREYALLEYLLVHQGRVVPREEISGRVWNMPFDTGTNFIDVYINYLRKKIDRDHAVKLIHTRPGMGFILHA